MSIWKGIKQTFSNGAAHVTDGALEPIIGSKQRIVGLVTATALTVPSGARVAIIQILDQAVRYWDDGSTPTATEGHQIPAGSTLYYVGDLTAIRFIQEVATTTLNVSYYS